MDGSMTRNQDPADPPTGLPAPENRAAVRLAHYWERLRHDRTLPSMRDVNPKFLPVVWEECFMIAIPGTGEPVFEYVGRILVADCGLDPAHRPVSCVPAETPLGKTAGCLGRVLSTRAPVNVEDEFIHQRGNSLLFRGTLLPFGDDAKTVDYVLGMATCCRMVNGRGEEVDASRPRPPRRPLGDR